MKNLIAIDGSAGAGKTTVARLVADRLAWPLTTADNPSAPAVIEGAGVLDREGLDPRWRFFLDASPDERNRRLAGDAVNAKTHQVTGSLEPDTILIDTTRMNPITIAVMIATLIDEEMES